MVRTNGGRIMRCLPEMSRMEETADGESSPEKTMAPAVDTHIQSCPVCGEPMSDLRGGRTSICANCGFKDACCY